MNAYQELLLEVQRRLIEGRHYSPYICDILLEIKEAHSWDAISFGDPAKEIRRHIAILLQGEFSVKAWLQIYSQQYRDDVEYEGYDTKEKWLRDYRIRWLSHLIEQAKDWK